MFKKKIEPRFCDTDALGHINNTVLPVWFSEARTAVCRLFSDDPIDLHVIVVRTEVDYMAEVFYGGDVEIRTYLSQVGRSSMIVTQEAWQNDKCCAKGNCVIVHFDHEAKNSKVIPPDTRKLLEPHLVPGE